jgi:hypothetical protein
LGGVVFFHSIVIADRVREKRRWLLTTGDDEPHLSQLKRHISEPGLVGTTAACYILFP